MATSVAAPVARSVSLLQIATPSRGAIEAYGHLRKAPVFA